MSSPPLRVFLSPEQDRTLFEIRTATTVPQRTKDRAEALRKSNQGWKVAQIAKHFNWAQSTVRQAIHRWQQEGLGGLWDEPRPGRQRQWQEEDIVYIEQSLEQEQRTYSSPQLLEKLKRERNVHLSQSHLRRVLKKRALDGNAHAKVTTISKTQMSVSASKMI